MNKSELLDAVASGSGVEKRQAEQVLDSFFETVQKTALGGDKVSWPGFGSFSTSSRGARTFRNPRTGEPVEGGPSTGMKFTSSSTLKDFLNGRGGGAAPATKAGGKKAPAKKAAPAAKKATKKATKA